MNPIMTTKEAAELLGIKTELVRRWCRDGHMPAVQLGREYRISRAALIDWWEEKGGGRLDFNAFYSREETKKDEQEPQKDPPDDEQKPKKLPQVSSRTIIR